jgi:hypothetical protein
MSIPKPKKVNNATFIAAMMNQMTHATIVVGQLLAMLTVPSE